MTRVAITHGDLLLRTLDRFSCPIAKSRQGKRNIMGYAADNCTKEESKQKSLPRKGDSLRWEGSVHKLRPIAVAAL
jgi:hypothetical protein